jgi:hypothetical protein
MFPVAGQRICANSEASHIAGRKCVARHDPIDAGHISAPCMLSAELRLFSRPIAFKSTEKIVVNICHITQSCYQLPRERDMP